MNDSQVASVSFAMKPFPANVHRLAKVRAAELGLTLKEYIMKLVLDDIERQQQARLE